MKEKMIETVSGTLFFTGILIAVGTVGADELGTIGLNRFVTQMGIAVVVMMIGRFCSCLE